MRLFEAGLQLSSDKVRGCDSLGIKQEALIDGNNDRGTKGGVSG